MKLLLNHQNNVVVLHWTDSKTVTMWKEDCSKIYFFYMRKNSSVNKKHTVKCKRVRWRWKVRSFNWWNNTGFRSMPSRIMSHLNWFLIIHMRWTRTRSTFFKIFRWIGTTYPAGNNESEQRNKSFLVYLWFKNPTLKIQKTKRRTQSLHSCFQRWEPWFPDLDWTWKIVWRDLIFLNYDLI